MTFVTARFPTQDRSTLSILDKVEIVGYIRAWFGFILIYIYKQIKSVLNILIHVFTR